jgi:hypothetical protein
MSEDAPTPMRIDLSADTEPTRRAVYDAVVVIFFSLTPEEIAMPTVPHGILLDET